MSTAIQSLYWAHQLTIRSASDSMENLSRSFSGAKVDLNPHQVDAALFAFRSPLSKGVLLADEVGLGKTIEAGLVVSQKWAERKRRILLILPATLRKQWATELEEKFFLPSIILDSTSYNQARQAGRPNPFDTTKHLVVCSYHFAAAMAQEIQQVSWDLVVIDEAHRLRNIYKGNKIANAIASATRSSRKLLLTATPLQNSLLELYGLVSVIDGQVFGDLRSFKNQFLKGGAEAQRNAELKKRLQPFCIRTLRRQVLEYVRYTERIPITQDFTPSLDEQHLYERISAYLQREDLLAIPNGQRTLLTLVLRKLLASSSFAIASALQKMVHRLSKKTALEDEDEDDFEGFSELSDEWEGEEGVDLILPDPETDQLAAELSELKSYAELASKIEANAKGTALVGALNLALEKAKDLGAENKAVIFTESRKTQAYLLKLLEENGYRGQIVTLNGVNTEPHSREIYRRWKERHAGEDITQGSQAVNIKSALVEEFKNHAILMIATEAAAEGVNLQFCSLVVNYDLPWNPQRIEQRIGRCHRYGQKNMVVVVNFLNRQNQADLRVFELLSSKFRLFDGVFGASDEVLGALESGVDLERRIAEVYQKCRTPIEIEAAFDQLQIELEDQIQSRMLETRSALLENFDAEVAAKLHVCRDKALESLGHRRSLLLKMTRTELASQATFHDDEPRFEVPEGEFRGHYHLLWPKAEASGATFFREDHPLAISLMKKILGRTVPLAVMVVDSAGHNVASISPFRGSSGVVYMAKLQVDTFDTEEFLLLSGKTEDGRCLDPEQCDHLLNLPARLDPTGTSEPFHNWEEEFQPMVQQKLNEVELRNTKYFDEEADKLENWSEDLKLSLEKGLKEIELQIREAKALKRAASNLQERLVAVKALNKCEAQRRDMRRDLYTQQDEVVKKRDSLIDEIAAQLKSRSSLSPVFAIPWRLI